MRNTAWTFAKYGPKTIGIGVDGEGAVYKVNTSPHSADDPRVVADMRLIVEALSATDNWTGK